MRNQPALVDHIAREPTESDGMAERLRYEDFGVCASCGRPLSFLRAMAHPGSCLCHHCEQATVDADQRGHLAA